MKTKIENRVINLVSKCFGIGKDRVNFTTTSKQIKKWDSVGQIRLILLIEKNFKIRIDQSNYENLLSIKNITSYIKKRKK